MRINKNIFISISFLILLFTRIYPQSEGSNYFKQIGNEFYEDGIFAIAIVVEDNYAFVASLNYLLIYDINNQDSISLISEYRTTSSSSKIIVDDVSLSIDENHLCLTDGSGVLQLFDISNPFDPIRIGYKNVRGGASDVVLIKNHAFVTSGENGLLVYDISGILIKEVAHLETNDSARRIQVSDEIAYIADYAGGLFMVDISNATNPKRINVYKPTGTVNNIFITGKFCFIMTGSNGVQIIDISDPTEIIKLGYMENQQKAWSISVNNSYAFLADGLAGIGIFDISNISQPVKMNYLDIGNFSHDVWYYDEKIYVANGYGGLQILDVEISTEVAQYFSPKEMFSLEQNYPNPFNPITTIQYSIPSKVKTSVHLGVFSILGREVITLVNEVKLPGNYEVNFNASNLPSGIYYYRLSSGNYSQTKKLLLLK